MINYRAYVGAEHLYDAIGAHQFVNSIEIGLREHHKFLDIGCGSLRGGKLFIMYLGRGNYFGIEPNQWLIDDAIKNETGRELINIKSPSFNTNSHFNLEVFNIKFDYLIAQSIFTHSSQNQIVTCCKSAFNVMNENSVFIATYIRGEENYQKDEWIYDGVSTYTYPFIKNLIESTGLKCTPMDWKHPNPIQSWLKITK